MVVSCCKGRKKNIFLTVINNKYLEMEEGNFSVRDLEMRTYRCLQQVAKSLSLPSNVKKVHLIQLIHAKKFKSETEVNCIIQQVKSERQQLVQSRRKNRKRNLQNREITSTSKFPQSPPISNTPKRSVHPVLRYSPDYSYSQNKCGSRQNYQPPPNLSIRSISGSDRVLRSFNLKALRKSYGAVNLNNTVTSSIRVQNQATSPMGNVVRIVSAGGKLTKINLKCSDRKHRPGILSGNTCWAVRNDHRKQYIVPHNPQSSIALQIANQEISVPQTKRQRTLSGIYPLIPQELPYQSCDQIQGLKLRRRDGRLSTINALVQKRNLSEYRPPPRQNNDINIQEILNSIDVNLNNITQSQEQLYPSNQNSTVTSMCYPLVSESKENERTDEYYHKKIRSEQMGFRRMSYREHEDRLPKITDVFSRFNCGPNRNVMQPLYVQVNNESQRIPNLYPGGRSAPPPATMLLESLFNFRASLLTSAPLRPVRTTNNTTCVYSTPLIASATVQPPGPPVASEPFNITQYDRDNVYRHDSEIPLYELLRSDQEGAFQRFENSRDISGATSPVSQATIPEMVEDALEIISQDGDYMERLGMDIRVQCVLCSWAGPKIILEFHIRKEHPSQLVNADVPCSAQFPLGVLCLWRSAVLERHGTLYVLSARRSPARLSATLCSLSSDPNDKFGTITMYNKVTGEPFSWEGPIQPLPPNLPYENDLPGLTVELSKLDLLPNSANLTLFNKELVLKSPTNVVVGQPDLNNIEVVMFVQIS